MIEPPGIPDPGTAMHYESPRGIGVLWFAMLAGPLAWMVGLNADYALVRLACARETMLPLHLVTLATLLLALAGAVVARREWRRSGMEWPGEGGSILSRARFMSVIGLMASLFFALVIVAQGSAKLFFDPCIGL